MGLSMFLAIFLLYSLQYLTLGICTEYLSFSMLTLEENSLIKDHPPQCEGTRDLMWVFPLTSIWMWVMCGHRRSTSMLPASGAGQLGEPQAACGGKVYYGGYITTNEALKASGSGPCWKNLASSLTTSLLSRLAIIRRTTVA